MRGNMVQYVIPEDISTLFGFKQISIVAKGGDCPNFGPPLGMIGNADAGRSYRQFCVPLSVSWGTPMKGRDIANFVYPARYDWERP